MKNTEQQGEFNLSQMNQSYIDKNYLTIGKALFPKDLHSKLKKQLLKPTNQKKFCENFWRISKRTLNLWLKFLAHMKFSNCQFFSVISVQNPEILTTFSHISFRNLKILFLGYNKIRSIEPIIFMDMKQIQSIFLPENQITNTKSLQKLAWPQLRRFVLYRNSIIDLRFERAKLVPEEKYQKMEFYESKTATCMNQDLNFLAKIQIQSRQQIWITSESRISQHPKEQAIKRKFLGTRFD